MTPPADESGAAPRGEDPVAAPRGDESGAAPGAGAGRLTHVREDGSAHMVDVSAKAGQNLDALVDSLRDLPEIWGGPVALLWEGAAMLARADGRGWWILGEILDEADLPVIAAGEASIGLQSDQGQLADGDGATW